MWQSHNQTPFQNERLPCQCQLNYGNTVVDAEHLDSIAHSGSLRSRSGSEFAIHSDNDSAAADNYNRCYGVGLDRGKDDQNSDPEAECIVIFD